MLSMVLGFARELEEGKKLERDNRNEKIRNCTKYEVHGVICDM